MANFQSSPAKSCHYGLDVQVENRLVLNRLLLPVPVDTSVLLFAVVWWLADQRVKYMT